MYINHLTKFPFFMKNVSFQPKLSFKIKENNYSVNDTKLLVSEYIFSSRTGQLLDLCKCKTTVFVSASFCIT